MELSPFSFPGAETATEQDKNPSKEGGKKPVAAIQRLRNAAMQLAKVKSFKRRKSGARRFSGSFSGDGFKGEMQKAPTPRESRAIFFSLPRVTKILDRQIEIREKLQEQSNNVQSTPSPFPWERRSTLTANTPSPSMRKYSVPTALSPTDLHHQHRQSKLLGTSKSLLSLQTTAENNENSITTDLEENVERADANFTRLLANPHELDAVQESISSPLSRDYRRGIDRMPNGKDLESYLPEVRAYLESRAKTTLQSLFVPRFHLKMRLKARDGMAHQQVHAVKLTTELIRRNSDTLKEMPDEALQILVSKAKYKVCERGDIIVFRGEPPTGIMFVTSGTALCLSSPVLPLVPATQPLASVSLGRHASVVSPIQKRRAGFRGRTTTQLSYFSPFIVGENVILSMEPHQDTLRAQTKCDVWLVDADVYAQAVSTLSPGLRDMLIDRCFEQRLLKLHRTLPLSRELLKTNKIFAACPDSVLDEVSEHLEPYCVPKNYPLFEIHTNPDFLLFLVHGRVAVRKNIRHQLVHINTLENKTRWFDPSFSLSAYVQELSNCANPSNTPIHRAFRTIGDDEILYKKPLDASYTTLTQCDCYRLSRSIFDLSVRMLSNASDKIQKSIRKTRVEEIHRGQLSYQNYLLNFPLVSHWLGQFSLKNLVRLFHPMVYKPMSVVCSTSEYCDRVILLIHGSVRIGGSAAGKWEVGEFAGYTGIVHHRWSAPAIAMNQVETLELPLHIYVAFLKDYNIDQKIREWSQHLMFPKAFPPEEVQATGKKIAHFVSPPLYPVSRSRKIELSTGPVTCSNTSSLMDVSGIVDMELSSVQHPEDGSLISAASSSSLRHYGESGTSMNESSRLSSKMVKLVPRRLPFSGMSRISSTTWIKRY